MPTLSLMEYIESVVGGLGGFFLGMFFLTLIMYLTFPKANYGIDIITVLIVEAIATVFFFTVKYFISSFIDSIYKKSGIKDVDKMSGEQFEHWLELLFKDYGYKVKRTRKTADYGADLIIEKDNIKIAVQAKRHKNKVGIKAVQEAISAVKFYGCQKAAVCTNNYFTENAVNLAKANNVELIDRDKLVKLSMDRRNN
ncbi:restriction endonuclease [Carboxydothermus hydrogenoformans]|uniref:Putative prophage LambdaCh01, restriction endonuclease n=1 Tax=Carboxydothermus hydrogenoformans (strain ATCC BAA-161 / DSM 6008 / Z-2901) TaxID=246194 RepID=Q3ABG4_CARHZ|nr:restriction endonuclease [Carboxydothermus hydrogenoformans]ABB15331.1 putative prophage LambdaCh01, restriction endonuclease [Carboxydothermus hydrogenoformans Z-2901]